MTNVKENDHPNKRTRDNNVTKAATPSTKWQMPNPPETNMLWRGKQMTRITWNFVKKGYFTATYSCRHKRKELCTATLKLNSNGLGWIFSGEHTPHCQLKHASIEVIKTSEYATVDCTDLMKKMIEKKASEDYRTPSSTIFDECIQEIKLLHSNAKVLQIEQVSSNRYYYKF